MHRTYPRASHTLAALALLPGTIALAPPPGMAALATASRPGAVSAELPPAVPSPPTAALGDLRGHRHRPLPQRGCRRHLAVGTEARAARELLLLLNNMLPSHALRGFTAVAVNVSGVVLAGDEQVALYWSPDHGQTW